MSAYLVIDTFPQAFHFSDLEPLTLREAVKKWMKASEVMSFNTVGDPMGQEIDGMLLNFGAVPRAIVTAEPPARMEIFELDETNLESL